MPSSRKASRRSSSRRFRRGAASSASANRFRNSARAKESNSLQIVGALEEIMKERSGGRQVVRLRVDDVFYLEETEGNE